MKVLMLGWEFPPFFAGGVGIACYELTRAMSSLDDVSISYVMPYGPEKKNLNTNLSIKGANTSFTSKKSSELTSVEIKEIPSLLQAYDGPYQYSKRLEKILKERKDLFSKRSSSGKLYGGNLIEEIYLFAQRVIESCKDDEFDVIHAHDWTTFPAAILLKEVTGKPVIAHVHITELDKTGGMGGDERVFEVERLGFNSADKIVAVSGFTKKRLIEYYGVSEAKISVIHNGGISDLETSLSSPLKKKGEQTVLFAGRMTTQKGPRFFLESAKKVLEVLPQAKFIMAGNGDLLAEMIALAQDLGIEESVYFHGKYSRDEADFFFSQADVFVMPSVSEPFGIVPLEAVAKGTPTVISKQSGISEVLHDSLKVDFWDTREMANKIVSLLQYPELHQELRMQAFSKVDSFSWKTAAELLLEEYKHLQP